MREQEAEFRIKRKLAVNFLLHGNFHVDSDDGPIADPSLLWLMGEREGVGQIDSRLYFPEELLSLVGKAKESMPHREFLETFLRYFGASLPQHKQHFRWDVFWSNYDALVARERLRTIEELGYDEKVFREMTQLFEKHSFHIELSPRRNILGNVMGKTISAAIHRMRPIIMKTRRFVNLLREKIVIVELPKQADKVVQAKRNVCAPITQFPGGDALKWFVGFALSVGGLVDPTLAPVGIAGIALVFLDP